MSRILAAAPLMMTLLAALGCGGGEEAESGATTPSPQVIDMTASDFSFSPDALSSEVGAPIEVSLKNTGQAAHTFTIDELDIDVEVAPGDETTVRVLASEAAELEYYCRFHRASGMTGSLTAGGDAAGGEAEQPTETADETPDDYDYGY
jgi:plastocyanin